MDVAEHDVIRLVRQFLIVSVLLVLIAKRFSPEVGNLNEFTRATVSFSFIMKLQQDL